MLSTTSMSTADRREKFLEEGIYCVKDAAVGERVENMQRGGMQIESADGLDFLKNNVMDDSRIQDLLKAIFPSYGLGIFEVYRHNTKQPDVIYSFMTGIEPFNSVVVQLLSRRSKLVYFEGSQLLKIEGYPTSIGLLEIIYAPLKQAKCRPVEVEMEEGGIVILDARMAFRIDRGYAIHFVFATTEELKSWPKKQFPNDQVLMDKAKAIEMENRGVGLNFTFGNR